MAIDITTDDDWRTYMERLSNHISLNIEPNDQKHTIEFKIGFRDFQVKDKHTLIYKMDFAESDDRNRVEISVKKVRLTRYDQNGNRIDDDFMPNEYQDIKAKGLSKNYDKKKEKLTLSAVMDEVLNTDNVGETAYIQIDLDAIVENTNVSIPFYVRNYNVNSNAHQHNNWIVINSDIFKKIYELNRRSEGSGDTLDRYSDDDPGARPPLRKVKEVPIKDKEYRVVWFIFYNEDDYLYCKTLNRYAKAQPNAIYDTTIAKAPVLAYDEEGNKKVEFDMKNLFRTSPTQLGTDELHQQNVRFVNGGVPDKFPIFEKHLRKIFEKGYIIAMGVGHAVKGDHEKVTKKGKNLRNLRYNLSPNELYWKWTRFRPEKCIRIIGKVIDVTHKGPDDDCPYKLPIKSKATVTMYRSKTSGDGYELVDTFLITSTDANGDFEFYICGNDINEHDNYIIVAEADDYSHTSEEAKIVNRKEDMAAHLDKPCGYPDNMINLGSHNEEEPVYIPMVGGDNKINIRIRLVSVNPDDNYDCDDSKSIANKTATIKLFRLKKEGDFNSLKEIEEFTETTDDNGELRISYDLKKHAHDQFVIGVQIEDEEGYLFIRTPDYEENKEKIRDEKRKDQAFNFDEPCGDPARALEMNDFNEIITVPFMKCNTKFKVVINKAVRTNFDPVRENSEFDLGDKPGLKKSATLKLFAAEENGNKITLGESILEKSDRYSLKNDECLIELNNDNLKKLIDTKESTKFIIMLKDNNNYYGAVPINLFHHLDRLDKRKKMSINKKNAIIDIESWGYAYHTDKPAENNSLINIFSEEGYVGDNSIKIPVLRIETAPLIKDHTKNDLTKAWNEPKSLDRDKRCFLTITPIERLREQEDNREDLKALYLIPDKIKLGIFIVDNDGKKIGVDGHYTFTLGFRNSDKRKYKFNNLMDSFSYRNYVERRLSGKNSIELSYKNIENVKLSKEYYVVEVVVREEHTSKDVSKFIENNWNDMKSGNPLEKNSTIYHYDIVGPIEEGSKKNKKNKNKEIKIKVKVINPKERGINEENNTNPEIKDDGKTCEYKEKCKKCDPISRAKVRLYYASKKGEKYTIDRPCKDEEITNGLGIATFTLSKEYEDKELLFGATKEEFTPFYSSKIDKRDPEEGFNPDQPCGVPEDIIETKKYNNIKTIVIPLKKEEKVKIIALKNINKKYKGKTYQIKQGKKAEVPKGLAKKLIEGGYVKLKEDTANSTEGNSADDEEKVKIVASEDIDVKYNRKKYKIKKGEEELVPKGLAKKLIDDKEIARYPNSISLTDDGRDIWEGSTLDEEFKKITESTNKKDKYKNGDEVNEKKVEKNTKELKKTYGT